MVAASVDDTKHFSSDDEDLLNVINLVTCGVSIVCSSFIVVSAVLTGLLQNHRLTGLRLVFMLSVTDVFYSIAYFIGDPASGSAECYAQAALGQFFGIASVGWPLAIAAFLWGTFILGLEDDQGPRFFWLSNAAIWSLSAVLTAIPVNHYDTAGAWCWIDQDGYGDAMRFGTFYIVVWCAILVIIAFYFSLLRSVTSILMYTDPTGHDTHSIDDVYLARMLRYMRRQCLFPVVLIVCWIMPTINRVHDVISDDPILWLSASALATSNLTGLFNAIVYGFIQTAWRSEMKRCCCGPDDDTEQPREKDPENEDEKEVSDAMADAFGDDDDEPPESDLNRSPTVTMQHVKVEAEPVEALSKKRDSTVVL